jgi:hypothetical protein
MTVDMVERNLKGIAIGDLAAAQRLALSTSNAYAAGGTPMRYIRSTFHRKTGAACAYSRRKAPTT